MTKEVVSVVVSRKKMKKATKRMSKRRKLRSALKRIFNYMKSDSYMFAPLIRRSQSSSPPVSTAGEVSFKPPMKKKEKKLVDGVNEYMKCDAYMYAPLASAYDGTATPPSGVENADVSNPNPIPIPIPLKQSERVKHIFHQNYHSLSSTTTTTGKVLSQKKPG